VTPVTGIALSGAARWLNPRKALIQQSLRHKSNDHFWFTFFHEAAHILLHSKRMVFIDEDNVDGNEQEQEANAWAANFLIPADALRRFAAPGFPRENAVINFSREQGIAVGIVVGRLQHEKIIRWRHYNGLKVRYEWR
jgi:Zn-dependent peptidase ImmA (M78 family)